MRTLDKQAMALIVATLIADQASKELLLRYLLKAGEIIQVIDNFLQLVIVWNAGVSFGILNGDRALPPGCCRRWPWRCASACSCGCGASTVP